MSVISRFFLTCVALVLLSQAGATQDGFGGINIVNAAATPQHLFVFVGGTSFNEKGYSTGGYSGELLLPARPTRLVCASFGYKSLELTADLRENDTVFVVIYAGSEWDEQRQRSVPALRAMQARRPPDSKDYIFNVVPLFEREVVGLRVNGAPLPTGEIRALQFKSRNPQAVITQNGQPVLGFEPDIDGNFLVPLFFGENGEVRGMLVLQNP